MGIYRGARAVIQGGAALGTSQKFADASARKAQGVRQAREGVATAKERIATVESSVSSGGLVDDGHPPARPVVSASAFFHQVDLWWARPPATEGVRSSLVRVRPEDEGSYILTRGPIEATIKNLEAKPHTFEVALVDHFGRESLWSDPVSATPLLTAAEQIDLTELAMAGRLQGLLPELNLSTITDATKLADELISSGKIAPGAITGPKLPDGVVSGPKIDDSAITAPKLAANSVEAEKVAAGAITTPKMAAGSVVADKIGANAVITEKLASDTIQTRHITAGAVTASVMAAQDAAAFNLWAQNAMIRSAAIQELVADKIVGGQFTAGTIDIVGGGMVRAGETELSSSGVKLGVLSGEEYVSENQHYKITSKTNQHSLYFRHPTTESPAHASVLQTDSTSSTPGMTVIAGMAEANDWDHNANAMLRVGSYNPSTEYPSFAFLRGANVASDGRWYAVLRASEGFAKLESLTDGAIVRGKHVELDAAQKLMLYGTLTPPFIGNPGTVSANSWAEWTHNFGTYPTLTCAFWHMGNGQFRPLPTSGTAGAFIDFVSASRVRITNNSAQALTVSCQVFR